MSPRPGEGSDSVARKCAVASPESSHEIGRFRFARAAYLEEPQRATLDPNVPEVVLDWASQCGKSELWLNGLLYWSVHAPSPALLVGPDWKSVKSLSADRIRPMFRDARLYDSRGDSDQGAEL
jgi:phage terminase large subunit GpA-like protein